VGKPIAWVAWCVVPCTPFVGVLKITVLEPHALSASASISSGRPRFTAGTLASGPGASAVFPRPAGATASLRFTLLPNNSQGGSDAGSLRAHGHNRQGQDL